jgi:hypothetical protein
MQTMWLRCIMICLLPNFGWSRSLLESSSPPRECTDTLHAYDPLPGVGLGQVVASYAAVIETFARVGRAVRLDSKENRVESNVWLSALETKM